MRLRLDHRRRRHNFRFLFLGFRVHNDAFLFVNRRGQSLTFLARAGPGLWRQMSSVNARDKSRRLRLNRIRPSNDSEAIARKCARKSAWPVRAGIIPDQPPALFSTSVCGYRPASGIGRITFCRAPPCEPCLRAQRDRERGWRDRGQCEHDAPLSRDARSRGV
jgi:hypothetical protein